MLIVSVMNKIGLKAFLTRQRIFRRKRLYKSVSCFFFYLQQKIEKRAGNIHSIVLKKSLT